MDQERLDNLRSDISIAKAEIVYIRSDVNKLLKIIVEGNGHSLMSRIAVNDERIKTIEENLDNIQSQSWAVKIAMLSGGLALIGTIIEFLLSRKIG